MNTSYLTLLLYLFVVSCTSKYSYKDLEWDGQSSARVVKLTKKSVNDDIELLLYALKEAYIGGHFINSKIYNDFIAKVKRVPKHEFKDNVALCKYLGDLFLELPDGHFAIWFPGTKCLTYKREKPNVGDNYGKKSNKLAYSIHSLFQKNTALLSIKSFPNPNSDKWHGFIESIQKLKTKENIIVDLRGNRGGNSRMGLRLSQELINKSVKHNREKIIRNNSAQAWTIYRNNILRNKLWLESKKQKFDHLSNEIAITDKNRIHAINNNQKYLIKKFNKPNLESLNYKGNIYVLVDKACGSSCEHTLEALKFHPNTMSVGENTYGAIHFGQMGLIRLQNSGIYIQLATQYFKLFNNGYYEKTGYRPDFIVPNGNDALEFCLEIIIKR